MNILIILLYIIAINNVSAVSFQNYDPSKITEISQPIVGSYLPYTNFDSKNLPTIPIVQNATNLANNSIRRVAIETVTPEQIAALEEKDKSQKPAIPLNDQDNLQKPIIEPIKNINPQHYHKINIEPQQNLAQNNSLTIIGSEGAIPMPEKPAEKPEIEAVPTQVVPVISVLRNTYKLNIPKKEQTIYTMTEKQKSGKNENLPDLQLKMNQNIGWKRQIMSPNIAQKIYTNSNTHLLPIIFQTELDSIAFKYIINPNDCNVLRSLLDKISSINIQDQDGNTLLIYSIYNFNHDAVIILLQRGANPNLCNDVGVSPIHLAATLNDDKAVKILVQYGADINIVDKTGSTAAMYAASSDNIKTIEYLINHNANLDIINNNGMNIIDFAKSSSNKNILDYLK
jgi:hypothetical protein